MIVLKIMDAYEGTGLTPQIETSDNAFKMILPNLNAGTGKKEPDNTKSKSSMEEEKVIALAKERGAVTRKEVEILLGISQTTCGRLIRKMIEGGRIVQEGKGKNTQYYLPQ